MPTISSIGHDGGGDANAVADGVVLVPTGQVRQRYGGRSHMWIERRLADPESGFPRPVYIGKRRYWRLADLVAWERDLASEAA